MRQTHPHVSCRLPVGRDVPVRYKSLRHSYSQRLNYENTISICVCVSVHTRYFACMREGNSAGFALHTVCVWYKARQSDVNFMSTMVCRSLLHDASQAKWGCCCCSIWSRHSQHSEKNNLVLFGFTWQLWQHCPAKLNRECKYILIAKLAWNPVPHNGSLWSKAQWRPSPWKCIVQQSLLSTISSILFIEWWITS